MLRGAIMKFTKDQFSFDSLKEQISQYLQESFGSDYSIDLEEDNTSPIERMSRSRLVLFGFKMTYNPKPHCFTIYLSFLYGGYFRYHIECHPYWVSEVREATWPGDFSLVPIPDLLWQRMQYYRDSSQAYLGFCPGMGDNHFLKSLRIDLLDEHLEKIKHYCLTGFAPLQWFKGHGSLKYLELLEGSSGSESYEQPFQNLGIFNEADQTVDLSQWCFASITKDFKYVQK